MIFNNKTKIRNKNEKDFGIFSREKTKL